MVCGLIWSLFTVSGGMCANDAASIIDSVKERLKTIHSYEVKAEFAGTKLATGELIWKSSFHIFWERPNKHAYRQQLQGYIINEEYPMSEIAEDYSVYDGKTQFIRTRSWGGKVEGTWPTLRYDGSPVQIGRNHRHGMAPESEYVETITKLLQSFNWTLMVSSDDTIIFKGIYVPQDRDFAYPGHVVQQWRYVPGNPVIMAVDRRRSLVTEYRGERRIITGNNPPGEVLEKTVFHEIHINPVVDEALFTYTPAKGEVVHVIEKNPLASHTR
jgi:hypothetical protein